MSRVLGIVPARGGSKRVPRKNTRRLDGKPLVAWALDAATHARSLATVVVSSDDDEVLSIARSFAGVVALKRPPELSTDTSPAIDYVKHALAELARTGHAPFESIAIVQPTSPFTSPRDIDAVVELLMSTEADSAVSVEKLDHAIHPAKLKRLVGDKLVPYLEDEHGRMAEHELPPLYVRNGSVYATRVRTLEGGSLLGHDSRGYVMDTERSLDINDELDLAFAEFLLERRR